MSLQKEQLLILDGACGTTLQTMDVPHSVWEEHEGCNEYLNISAPEIVTSLHSQFLKSGAMAIETNTFGASSIVLSEYNLQDKVREININAVNNAKKAIAELNFPEKKYILGSIGPTTKLPTLGHIDPEALQESIKEQVSSLLDGGVDALIVETCQDILQVKTTLICCFECIEAIGKDIPVLCSVTFEKQGTMLIGTDIGAVCATLSPFPVFSLGLNCATGPLDMLPHIKYLKKVWQGRISCVPNQGMPEVKNGQTVYPMTPEEYASHMYDFVTEHGVSIVGGCCGTSPAHIKQLVKKLKGTIPQRVFS